VAQQIAHLLWRIHFTSPWIEELLSPQIAGDPNLQGFCYPSATQTAGKSAIAPKTKKSGGSTSPKCFQAVR
jgi:hypothetical protein